MVDFRAEFAKVEKEVSERKTQQATLEERKRLLEEEMNKVVGQLKEFGVNSIEEAQRYLETTEKTLTEGLRKCQEIIAA